jgi:hypothetical protein
MRRLTRIGTLEASTARTALLYIFLRFCGSKVVERTQMTDSDKSETEGAGGALPIPRERRQEK